MGVNSYSEQIDIDNTYRLRMLISTLPPYAKDYFRGIQPHTESRTRIAYAYDLNVFFSYLHENNPIFAQKEIRDITLDDLEKLRPTDIEEYLEYLSYYVKDDGTEYTNDERGKRRKLASLRSFYNYFFRDEQIKSNPASLVPMPKLHDKEIVRLDPNEVAILLDQVEDGTKMTKSQMKFHDKTKVRDLALLTLLLGTGIRVSECVGLDISDVDFDNLAIKVRRKGGYEDVVYFGEEVEEALLSYLDQRKHMIPMSGHEDALFLSLQNRRMAVRSVENLVKKYASLVTTTKKITPHKLRSTYGTTLYQETGDIYLVADVLGHKDVNTTRKHYAAMKDDHKRKAAKTVKLREL